MSYLNLKLGRWLALVAMLALLLPLGHAAAQADSRYFPETNHTLRGGFLLYWNSHGALAQQGYPITDEFAEVNDADGRSYTTQYFQRARFEFHPEQTDPQYQVLLGLLGREIFLSKYPGGELPPGTLLQTVPGGGSFTFAQTGQTVTGLFLSYWQAHGGLAQQGYPITPAFIETNEANGLPYITQYFERARFEYHPENNDPQYKVLLGLVGYEAYLRKQHGGPAPTPSIPVPPQVSPASGTVFHNLPRSVTFTWNPITWSAGAVTYNVDVDYLDSNGWHNYITQKGIAGTSYYLPDFGADRQGRWRVWATTPQGDSGRSGWWSFGFITNPPATTQVFKQITVGGGGHTGAVSIGCPANSVVVGGGWASNAYLVVYESVMDGNGWRVSALNNNPNGQLLNSYAICLSGAGGTPVQEADEHTIAPGATDNAFRKCTNGIVVGVGFSKDFGIAVTDINYTRGGILVRGLNTTAASRTLSAYVVCLTNTTLTTSTQVQQDTPVNPGATGNPVAVCDAGTLLTGGGFATISGVPVYTENKKDNGWQAFATNTSSTAFTLSARAICTKVP